MFERFTDRARRVVVLAQEEARLLGHNFIGTEHILLGLIHEGEGVAATALESLGIGLEAVRERVTEIVGVGTKAQAGHIPFTPRAKKVLELSLREALQLGHNYIGTEHILLGLIREGEGVAAQVLVSMGADLNRVRLQVITLVHPSAGAQAGPPGEEARLAGPLPAAPSRRELVLMSGIRQRMSALEARLALLESRAGTGPDSSELDKEIAKVRGERQSAANLQDYENAAVLRDRERALLEQQSTRREEWLADNPSLPELAKTVRELGEEVARLRRLLREPPQAEQLAGEVAETGQAAGGDSAETGE